MTTAEAVVPTAPEYGACVIAMRGIRPVVTQADDKVQISDDIVRGANSINTPWLRLNGNLLTICDVTYNLVAWDRYAHVGIKVKPPRQRRRTSA